MDVQLLINQTGINTEILIRHCPCIHMMSNFFMTCKFLTIAVCLTLENKCFLPRSLHAHDFIVKYHCIGGDACHNHCKWIFP